MSLQRLVELAGNGDPARLVRLILPRGERVETVDAARGQMRHAVIALAAAVGPKTRAIMIARPR